MKKILGSVFFCVSLVMLSVSTVFASQDDEMMNYDSSSCPSDQMYLMLERFDDVLTKKADQLDAIAGQDPNNHGQAMLARFVLQNRLQSWMDCDGRVSSSSLRRALVSYMTAVKTASTNSPIAYQLLANEVFPLIAEASKVSINLQAQGQSSEMGLGTAMMSLDAVSETNNAYDTDSSLSFSGSVPGMGSIDAAIKLRTIKQSLYLMIEKLRIEPSILAMGMGIPLDEIQKIANKWIALGSTDETPFNMKKMSDMANLPLFVFLTNTQGKLTAFPNPALCSVFTSDSYEYRDCAQSMGEMYTMMGQQGLFLVALDGKTMTLTINRDSLPLAEQQDIKDMEMTLSMTDGAITKFVVRHKKDNEGIMMDTKTLTIQADDITIKGTKQPSGNRAGTIVSSDPYEKFLAKWSLAYSSLNPGFSLMFGIDVVADMDDVSTTGTLSGSIIYQTGANSSFSVPTDTLDVSDLGR